MRGREVTFFFSFSFLEFLRWRAKSERRQFWFKIERDFQEPGEAMVILFLLCAKEERAGKREKERERETGV